MTLEAKLKLRSLSQGWVLSLTVSTDRGERAPRITIPEIAMKVGLSIMNRRDGTLRIKLRLTPADVRKPLTFRKTVLSILGCAQFVGASPKFIVNWDGSA